MINNYEQNVHRKLFREALSNNEPTLYRQKYWRMATCLPLNVFHFDWFNGVFPKYFHWIRWIQWTKNCRYSKRIRTCHSATSFVRDQDATSAPARHMWETGILSQTQFMLQWLSVSLNSLNPVKVLFHLGKTRMSNCSVSIVGIDHIRTNWDSRSQERSFIILNTRHLFPENSITEEIESNYIVHRWQKSSLGLSLIRFLN